MKGRKALVIALVVLPVVAGALLLHFFQTGWPAIAGGEPQRTPIDRAQWPTPAIRQQLLLVNRDNPLPEGYEPDDLVNLYEFKDRHFELARADIELCEEVYEQMDAMFAAAGQDGIDGFIVTSGYRSEEKQLEVFADNTDGTAAEPGQSEHQTGLAFDVTARGNSNFERTPQLRWLLEHCGDYGFILRYPKEAQDITGFPYEPWHYRYVGLPHSQFIMDGGITLEEYTQE